MWTEACPSEQELAALLADPQAEEAWWQDHLAACARCREAADRLLDSDGARQALRAIAAGRSAVPPPQLEQYEILAELRRGGQGIVYAALQKSTGRRVALKVLPPDRSPSARMRMEREFQLLRRLERPGLVRLYDSGESSGARWLAMELVDGVHFDAWLREGKIPIGERVGLLAEVARALHFAHQQGVVHRDLKPSNILVDRDGRPHVLDFGMGKPSSEAEELTRSGEFAGTIAWAAPEQLTGSAVDCRCDVYALGVLLYLAVTGKHPFAVHDGLRPLVDAIGRGDFPAPSRQVAAVDRELEAIVLRAMANAPGDRYPSAAALARDLDCWQRGEPVLARGIGPGRALLRLCRRHRLATAFTAAALLATGLAAGIGIDLVRRTASAEQERGEVQRLLAARELADAEAGLWPVGEGIGGRARAWLAEVKQLQTEATVWRRELADAADWRRERLRQLVHGVERLGPLAASVAWRLERTAELADSSGGWSALLADMGRGRYERTRVVERNDLVPLRKDPSSGLWEAWHVPSGERPRTDEQGSWSLTEASGLVFVLLPERAMIADQPMPRELAVPALWVAKYPLTRGQWVRTQSLLHDDDALVPVDSVPAGEAGRGLGRLGLRAPSSMEQMSYVTLRSGTLSMTVFNLDGRQQRVLARRPPVVTALPADAMGLCGMKDAFGELRSKADGDGQDRFGYGLLGGDAGDDVQMPRSWIRPVLDAR